jgi:lactate permease
VIYFVYASPILTVAVLAGSGRVAAICAGGIGAALAIVAALLVAPIPMSPYGAALAACHGAWLACLVGAVILAGLLFRELIMGDPMGHQLIATGDPLLRRRQLFTTCFLLGPFTEAATGFGVGQVATVPALRSLALSPIQIVLFGLFSQTMVPWGALANGTIVGARLAGVSARELGMRSAILTVPLLAVWLLLFWRIARQARVRARPHDYLAEALWLAAAAVLLVAANIAIGPEVAALAALGPLLIVRFVLHEQPDRAQWRAALRTGLPFLALIGGLAATRAIPQLNAFLAGVVTVQPFRSGPALFSLLHPPTWLVATGLTTAILLGRFRHIGPALMHCWTRGRKPCAVIVCFLVMAQVMEESGIAGQLARGLQLALGSAAVLATPLIAGLFGFLTSSGNATNGLLMASQASLAAAAHLNLAWVAAVQNTAAAALTMISPVRIAMGCALVGQPALARLVTASAWPLAASSLAVLVVAATIIAFG